MTYGFTVMLITFFFYGYLLDFILFCLPIIIKKVVGIIILVKIK